MPFYPALFHCRYKIMVSFFISWLILLQYQVVRTQNQGEVLCNRENAQCYEGQCTATSQYCNPAIQCNKTTLIGAAGCVPDQCQPSQFKCNNGLCIPSHNWCNFQYNCEDMSDEQNCIYPKCNQFTEIKCQSGQCISRVLRCDGYNDCYDGSDEEYCGYPSCHTGTFTCFLGRCIDIFQKCENKVDCWDTVNNQNCLNPKSCNRYLTAANGNFSTPNYPSNYPVDSFCTYTIAVPERKKVILNFQIVDFSFCPDLSSFLSITDGNGNKLLNFCGTRLFKPILSYGITKVTFYGGKIEAKGFRATYTMLSRTESKCSKYQFKCLQGPCIPLSEKCNHAYNCPDWSDEANCPPSCQHSLSTLSGIISFHSFSNRSYPQIFRCQYDIKINSNAYQTRIKFRSYNLTGLYDKLYIMTATAENGYKNYSTRLVFTQSSSPGSYLFDLQAKVRVVFESNYVISDIGFEILYDGIIPCHNSTTGQGIITSPNFPHNYPNRKFCVYNISADLSYDHVIINFTNFQLEQESKGSACSFDYVAIYDGHQALKEYQLGVFCGQLLLPMIRSSKNSLLIYFFSDYIINLQGFRAEINQAKQENCTDYRYVTCPDGDIIEANRVCDGVFDCSDHSDEIYCYYPKCLRGNFSCIAGQCIDEQGQCQNPYHCLDENGQCNCVKKYKKVITFIDQDYGIIETPDVLQRNEEINYIILVDDESKVLLSFLQCIAKLTCNNPTFTIYLNQDNSSHTLSLCRQETPWPAISQANFLRIRYNVGSTIEYVKLKASFRKVLDTDDNTVCPENYFSCASIEMCVPNAVVCNGKYDCYDWTDELDCEYSANCSVSIQASNGYITSPNYPQPYPNNLRCAYLLRVDSGYTISITIEDLQLQSSYNHQCATDVLTILNPKFNKVERILYCGDIYGQPITLESATNEILIKFSSDSLYSYKGYKISFKTGQMLCRQSLDAQLGSIVSPRYPNKYPYSMDCLYNIDISYRNKSESLLLFFEFLSLEYSRLCSYDFVRFNISQDHVTTLCGSKQYWNPFRIPSLHTVIQFHSDLSVTGRGFIIFYTTDAILQQCPKYTFDNDGDISSPDYPKYYQGMIYCSYDVAIPENETIMIKFQLFDAGKKTQLENFPCNQSYLSVAKVSDKPVQICGSSNPAPIYLSGGKFALTFRSYSNNEPLRFYGRYKRLSIMQETFTNLNGTIKSPGYPDYYFGVGKRHFLITVPGGYHVSLTLHGNVPGGSLVIKSGLNEFDETIQKLYNRIQLTKIRTSKSKVLIIFEPVALFNSYFYVDYISSKVYHSCSTYSQMCKDGTRFADSLQCDGNTDCVDNTDEINCDLGNINTTTCNHRFQKIQGVIKSYGYPNSYPPNSECSYKITVPPGNQIILSLQRFYIPESPSCSIEYLLVYDGPQRSSPTIGQFCGKEIPKEIKSTSNNMLIHFRSRKRQSSATGFIGFYQISTLYERCQGDNFTCFTGECIQHSKRCNGINDCQDHSDEYICGNVTCLKSEYKCDSGECVPLTGRCTTLYECKDDSQAKICRSALNNELFQCRNGHYINWNSVCNGKSDCENGWDEMQCPKFKCQERCKCRDHIIDCSYANYDHIPDIPSTIKQLILKGNHLVTLKKNDFIHLNQLGFLDLSSNRINKIDTSVFQSLKFLYSLNLNSNQIKSLYKSGNDTTLPNLRSLYLENNTIEQFSGSAINSKHFILLNLSKQSLSSIKGILTDHQPLLVLDLSGNLLNLLECAQFEDSPLLRTLILSNNNFTSIPDKCFQSLKHLKQLDLSMNRIKSLTDFTFSGLKNSLRTLYLQGNNIEITATQPFVGLNLSLLVTSHYSFCCIATAQTCLPPFNVISNCADLMANTILRASIWIVGIIALVGNLFVLIWRLKHQNKNSMAEQSYFRKLVTFFMGNAESVNVLFVDALAIADLMMAIYLIIIGSTDIYYRKKYSHYDGYWRKSPLCHFAGFLATLSCQMSVYILTAITVDRLICIISPYSPYRINLSTARKAIFWGWLIVIVTIGIPLLPGIPYFRNFYGRSSVCLPFHFSNQVDGTGWQYSISVITVVNLIACMFILLAYLALMIKLKTRKVMSHRSARQDRVVTVKMILVIGTNLCCWLPIIAITFLAMFKIHVPRETIAWIAVFVLPLNSAMNPVIYTIATQVFKDAFFKPRMGKSTSTVAPVSTVSDIKMKYNLSDYTLPSNISKTY